MFVLIKGNGPAVYLAVYLTAGSNKQLPLFPYYCQPRWRLRAYQQIPNPALLSRIYMFRNIGFWTPKPIKLANMLFQTNKLRMVMSCNCNGSHRSIGKCYTINWIGMCSWKARGKWSEIPPQFRRFLKAREDSFSVLNLQKEKTHPPTNSGLCLPNCVWHRRCSSNHKYLRNSSHSLLKPIRPNSILPRCPNHAIIYIPAKSKHPWIASKRSFSPQSNLSWLGLPTCQLWPNL